MLSQLSQGHALGHTTSHGHAAQQNPLEGMLSFRVCYKSASDPASQKCTSQPEAIRTPKNFGLMACCCLGAHDEVQLPVHLQGCTDVAADALHCYLGWIQLRGQLPKHLQAC